MNASSDLERNHQEPRPWKSWGRALPPVIFCTWLGWRLGRWFAFSAGVWVGLGLGIAIGILSVMDSSPASEAPRSEAS